jgi:hypothetical protein
MTEDGESIGSTTLDNNRARQLVSNMEELIELSVATGERKELYKFAVRKYNAATLILRQKKQTTQIQTSIPFSQSIPFSPTLTIFFRFG